MKEEAPICYTCHPSCAYRKLIHGKGIICTCEDSGITDKIINAEFGECPLPIDHFNHMDAFYGILRTEKGLVGLCIISGEPLMVIPAFRAYACWLRKRRRNVSVWKSPYNITYPREEPFITDVIYAELILGKEISNYIMELARDLYPSFEKTLPGELKALSQTVRSTYSEMWKMRTTDSIHDEKPDVIKEFNRLSGIWYDAKRDLLHKAYAASKDGKISRIDFLRIRNYFEGW